MSGKLPETSRFDMLDYYRFVCLNLLEVITDKGYILEDFDLLQHLYEDEHNISELILLAALSQNRTIQGLDLL